MAHVELSLSELVDSSMPERVGAPQSPLDLWVMAVEHADEPCLLLSADAIVVAASPGCGQLLAIDPVDAVGRSLVGGVLRLLDFNAVSGELPGWEIDKIPPLLAISSGGLARGLLRVSGPDGATTIDAISAPLRTGDVLVGSLTFFAPVGRSSQA